MASFLINQLLEVRVRIALLLTRSYRLGLHSCRIYRTRGMANISMLACGRIFLNVADDREKAKPHDDARDICAQICH